MATLQELFNQIKILSARDDTNVSEKLNKVGEEVGELFTAVNRDTGRKRHNLDPAAVVDNIAEEGADAIQNIFCVLQHYGITLEEVLNWLERKNVVWGEVIDQKWIDAGLSHSDIHGR